MEKFDGGFQSKAILIWNFIQNVDDVYCLFMTLIVKLIGKGLWNWLWIQYIVLIGVYVWDCLGGPKMLDDTLM
jgi:hypothetical protein